jgi:hypothetical protein
MGFFSDNDDDNDNGCGLQVGEAVRVGNDFFNSGQLYFASNDGNDNWDWSDNGCDDDSGTGSGGGVSNYYSDTGSDRGSDRGGNSHNSDNRAKDAGIHRMGAIISKMYYHQDKSNTKINLLTFEEYRAKTPGTKMTEHWFIEGTSYFLKKDYEVWNKLLINLDSPYRLDKTGHFDTLGAQTWGEHYAHMPDSIPPGTKDDFSYNGYMTNLKQTANFAGISELRKAMSWHDMSLTQRAEDAVAVTNAATAHFNSKDAERIALIKAFENQPEKYPGGSEHKHRVKMLEKREQKVATAKAAMDTAMQHSEKARIAKEAEDDRINEALKTAQEEVMRDKAVQDVKGSAEQKAMWHHNKLVHEESVREQEKGFEDKKNSLATNFIKDFAKDGVISMSAALLSKISFLHPVLKLLGVAVTMRELQTIGENELDMIRENENIEKEIKTYCDSIRELNKEYKTDCELCSIQPSYIHDEL